MLTANKLMPQGGGLAPVLLKRAATVELDWDVRQKSRFDTTDSQGRQIGVFLPCTPNPTTGFFFYLPRREVVELSISVEDGAKLIMSAGLIQPGENGSKALPGNGKPQN